MARKGSSQGDYCIIGQSAQHRLSPFERLTLSGGQELSKAITWIGKQLLGFKLEQGLFRIDSDTLLRGVDFYRLKEWQDNPEKFFIAPSLPKTIKETSFHGLTDGEVIDISFESAYQVRNQQVEEAFNKYKENRTVHARLWKHDRPALGTMIAVHGWTMGDQRLNSLAFLPGLFYQLGLNVALFELPFHGRRRPQEKTVTDAAAHLFPSTDIARTNEAMGQAISDLRELKLYLEGRGFENIGCIGMSLGAYVSSLWASLDALSYCVALVPMVSMGEMAWEILSRDPDLERLKIQGLSFELLQELYQIHCPLSHAPKISRDKLLIVAGLLDAMIPARQPKLLWDHWKRPKIHWLRGGHVAQFASLEVFEEIKKFLCNLGYAKENSKSPN